MTMRLAPASDESTMRVQSNRTSKSTAPISTGDEKDRQRDHAAVDPEVPEQQHGDSPAGHEPDHPEDDLRRDDRDQRTRDRQHERDDHGHGLGLLGQQARGELQSVQKADARDEEPVEPPSEDEEEETDEDDDLPDSMPPSRSTHGGVGRLEGWSAYSVALRRGMNRVRAQPSSKGVQKCDSTRTC